MVFLVYRYFDKSDITLWRILVADADELLLYFDADKILIKIEKPDILSQMNYDDIIPEDDVYLIPANEFKKEENFEEFIMQPNETQLDAEIVERKIQENKSKDVLGKPRDLMIKPVVKDGKDKIMIEKKGIKAEYIDLIPSKKAIKNEEKFIDMIKVVDDIESF